MISTTVPYASRCYDPENREFGVPCFPLQLAFGLRAAAAAVTRARQRSAGTPRMCEPCAPDALLEAVRGLRVAEPDLGLKPLLAKLREQRPELGAATKEVREALATLKAESEAAAKAAARAAASPAAAKRGAPSDVALSLRCIGCARLPSEMPDGREKHPICDKCKELKLQTTYMCGMDCPANPGAWELHGVFHKKLRKDRKRHEDGGERQQEDREAAEGTARIAAQTGDAYAELLAKGSVTPLSRTIAEQPRPSARPSR